MALKDKPLGDYERKASKSIQQIYKNPVNTNYTDLSDVLNEYEAATTREQELMVLQNIELLANEWLAKHGASQNLAGTAKAGRIRDKTEIIRSLLESVKGKFANLHQEKLQEYSAKWQNTSLTAGAEPEKRKEIQDQATFSHRTVRPFEYMTFTGRRASTPEYCSDDVRNVLRSNDRGSALRKSPRSVSTQGDYKYINPVLVHSKEWLERSIDDLRTPNVEGAFF